LDLDDDEALVLFLGVAVAGRASVCWYRRLLSALPARSAAGRRVRTILFVLPVALVAALLVALRLAAAREVREQCEYTLLFLALGVVCLGLGLRALSWLGVSAIDDAIERENVAAGWAVAGVMGAAAIAYAFANFGEGPTIWTTIGPVVLGVLSCNVLWAVHQAFSGASEAISIGRDVGAGVRFAGMAIGSSAIVGRALAGDYFSVDETCYDWARLSLPAVPLVLVAIVVERRMPRRGNVLLQEFLPALGYVVAGIVDIVRLGRWWSGGTP